MSIGVFDNLWKSLNHILSCSKACLPKEGGCIVSCMSPNKNMYLPKKVCTFIRPIQHIIQIYPLPVYKHVPPFVFVQSRQMREMWKGNNFFWPTFYELLIYMLAAPFCNIHFVIKFSHLEISAPVCNKECPLCNKLIRNIWIQQDQQ